jgi:hypothetical protein
MKSCMVSLFILSLVSSPLATVPRAAAAQESNAAVFAEVLKAGDFVRLAAPGLVVDSAVVLSVTTDSLQVEQRGQSWRLSSRSIQRLDVQRNLARRWTIGGALMGLPLGALAEHFLSQVGCGNDCEDARHGVGAIRGTLVLGLVGFAIGSVSHRWIPLMPG